MRSRLVLLLPRLGLAALVAGCGVATTIPAPTYAPPTSAALASPAPSPTALPTPVIGACPQPPDNPSPVAAPFRIGPGYAISAGEGGIDRPPEGLVSLSAWNIAGPGGCIASILAFTFGSADHATAFARTQAEGVGLQQEQIAGTTAWFSASGDAARLAIGPLALNVNVDAADPVVARDLVQSILEASR